MRNHFVVEKAVSLEFNKSVPLRSIPYLPINVNHHRVADPPT